MDTQAETEQPKGSYQKKTNLGPLPKSSDKDFWGDAEQVLHHVEKPTLPPNLAVVQMGSELIVQGLGYEASVAPVDARKFRELIK